VPHWHRPEMRVMPRSSHRLRAEARESDGEHADSLRRSWRMALGAAGGDAERICYTAILQSCYLVI
jgi:hypothetical protein